MMFPNYRDINTLIQIPSVHITLGSVCDMHIKKYGVRLTKFDNTLYKSILKSVLREKRQILCVHIQFYCNKATCTLLTFKTEHHLSFPVKQKENLKINRNKITIEKCQFRIRSYKVLLILPWSGRTQVIIRREFYFKSVILNCKDVH